MIKIEGFSKMLEVIHDERGLPKETLIDAVKMALISACKRRFNETDNLVAEIDVEGQVNIYAKKKVVKDVTDPEKEITPSDAKKIVPKAKIDDEVKVDVTPNDFGRVAAQTAKQIIIQRIREAEKDMAFDEFSKKQGDLVTGEVQRKEYGGYLVNLGRIETLLPFSEAMPGEILNPKDKIKLLILEAKKTPKGPQILISRSSPDLVKKLFELEVPEIGSGVLEIKGIAREAGRRTKIAVQSKDKNVGAVGTCVGHMGNRIQNIVRELGIERVDIVEWSKDPSVFISNALSPAKPLKIEINKEDISAKVIVPKDQLSLAIGKEGQNVRLAVKLTGWKIDIISNEEPVKEVKEPKK